MENIWANFLGNNSIYFFNIAILIGGLLYIGFIILIIYVIIRLIKNTSNISNRITNIEEVLKEIKDKLK